MFLSAVVSAVAPQLPVIVIVADVVLILSIRFVKISTNAVLDSWQLFKLTDVIKIIVHLSRLLHPVAKLVKSVTEVVVKLGINCKE